MQVYVALISLFYQFISLASEFTCVSLLVSIISPEAPTIVPVLAVAIITNIYTLVGGLRASLATDVWQGIGVLTLVLLVVIAVLSSVAIPDNAWKDTQIAAFTVPGFETLVTLCIAVTSANLFFTGYWQRVSFAMIVLYVLHEDF
jgi:SSS family solute:Na+ symporter